MRGTASKQSVSEQFTLLDHEINEYFTSLSYETMAAPLASLQPLIDRLGDPATQASVRTRTLAYLVRLAGSGSAEVDSETADDFLRRLARGDALLPRLPVDERVQLCDEARRLLNG